MTPAARAGPALIRPARLADAAALAPRLRWADRREVAAAGGEPLSALQAGVTAPGRAFAVEIAGEVSALFGVIVDPAERSVGAAWALAADAFSAQARAVARFSRPWVAALGRGLDALTATADARNAAHLRWLAWCGFQPVERLEGYGVGGETFIVFARQSSQQEGDMARSVNV